ncbi:MAG: hypothetical protein IKJ35_03235 [Clostridia bacterium]|nr:hypothetical protein [Clostridia bacterium]
MKAVLKKIANVIEIIFGYGILICLFVGGLTFFAYVVALIIGGDPAAAICAFMKKTFYPILILIANSMVLLGLVKMYLCGEVALSSKKEKKTENKQNKDPEIDEDAIES